LHLNHHKHRFSAKAELCPWLAMPCDGAIPVKALVVTKQAVWNDACGDSISAMAKPSRSQLKYVRLGHVGLKARTR
jgi:DNA-binding helix-hairpin-helix protein with protein kinase domain